MCRSVAMLAVIIFAAEVRAEDGIPAKTLNEIKAATVFVKVETTRATASGSGFLMQVDGETGLIVTNQHVVQLPVQAGPVRRIEVVFHSGKAKEFVVQAELIAADAERDLAVLRVKKVADLPKPLDHKMKVELSETMTVYALGFPFGDALSTGKANPSITIGKGSISSLRENKDGELSLIQIDGDINPGNSGGPVVDGKGQLVGVAVAKVRGTNIGIAIPAKDLTLMLRGRLGGDAYRVVGVEGNTIELEIVLKFIDPLDKIQSASILVATAKPGTPIPKATKLGQHPELTDAKVYEVKVADQKGLLKVKLPIERHFMQILYTTEEKKDIRVAITAYDLATIAKNFRPAPTVGPSTTPTPGEATMVGDLTVRRVRIAAEQKPAPGVQLGFPIACLTWDADGKAFFAYDHNEKTVRKISFPDLKEQAKFEVKKSCSWLSLSSVGLIATLPDDQEAWVLDPVTLKKGITFPTNKAKRVVSAPKLDVAYVADSDDFGGGTLRVVDLKTGKKLKEYESRDLDRNCGFKTLILSPDGKHLFAVGGIEQLVQLSADREKVAFVAVSERLVQGAFQQPVVSSDGKFICAPSGGGNYKIKASKEGNYATCVFNVGNLADPAVQLKTGAYPVAVGFDSKAKLFYAQNREDHLIVLDAEGSKLKSYKIAKENISVIQILPHPDGRKMLILANGIGFGETNVYSVVLD